MTSRLRLTLPAALVALLLAGCGGSDGGGSGAGFDSASVVPADAIAYVSIDSDLQSDQWDALRDHLDSFPDGGRLVDQLLSSLAEENVSWDRDVEPAIGPEVAVVALPGEGGDSPSPVVLTQSDDPAKLDALFARSNQSSERREIDGWQAVAEDTADLDAYAAALDEGSIEDDDTFDDATADLPDEPLMTVFVDGQAVRDAASSAGEDLDLRGLGDFQWLSGAAEAVDQGIRFAATYKAPGLDAVENYEPSLLDRVPSDAIAVASFKGTAEQLEALRGQPALGDVTGKVESTLGVGLDELTRLLRGEGAFYVRPAAPIPELTLLLSVEDEASAKQTLDRLAGRLTSQTLAQRGNTTLGGAPASFVDIQGFRITYSVAGGVATVTTARALSKPGEGEQLSDSGNFGEAKDASGLGDETAGFLYVDLERAVSLIGGFAGIAGQEVPPELERNLRPLRSLLTHASRDGDEISSTSLLTIE